jgi:hypothetical protein
VKVVNPLSAEPAKSGNSKDNSLNKKLKEIDGSAVSSGNSEKTRWLHDISNIFFPTNLEVYCSGMLFEPDLSRRTVRP